MIAAKFGGSSLADAATWRQVRAIIASDPRRKYIVVSAPGKRFASDEKVTDLLLKCHALASQGEDIADAFERVALRYRDIASALSLSCPLDAWLHEVQAAIQAGESRDFVASRGEYLCARLFAAYMDLPFIDATEGILFDESGQCDYEATNEALSEALLKRGRGVIPGFYGRDAKGKVKTFSRGGSDVTGALVACAIRADLYENWTDITGFRSADPRVVPDASFIANMTYRELRELSYMGASVLHEDAVLPVRKHGIATSLRNTFDPKHPGTMIHYSVTQQTHHPLVTGVAGQKGFTLVSLEKDNMNSQVGFGRHALEVFERHGISFEHMPTGIDAMCVVVDTGSLSPVRETLLRELEEELKPDVLSVQDNLAMLATVGTGMQRQCGVAARLFTCLAEQGISIQTLSQIPSELSIIVGIDEQELNRAISAVYDAFLRA